MPDADQVYTFVYQGYWSMTAQATFGGVTTGMTVPASAIIAAGLTEQDIIIDGITVRYVHPPAGGVEMRPVIYTPSGQHYLYPVTTATMLGAWSYAPLGMSTRLGAGDAFMLGATTANLDTCVLSAWGRLFPKDAPEPMPVDVKSVRLWPKRLREGPI